MSLLLDAPAVPRVLLLPQAVVRSSGPDCAELGSECGIDLDPWQCAVLDGAMSEREDDSWAASDVGLIASRQNGKNGLLGVREAYGLTVLHERIIHTAHQFKTTLEDWDFLLSLIEDGPLAEDLIGKHATPAQGYVMRFRGGGKINFIARSRMSGRGLTGDLLVFNEAQDLDNAAQGALLPTISARPGAQVWYLGSAPGDQSMVFHRLRKRGRAGTESRLAFFEFSAEPDADPADREAWRQANPAFGVRITEEAIEAEYLSMDPIEFARERLSISPDLEVGSGIIPAEKWAAAFDELSGPVGRLEFSIDVTPERDWSSIGVAAASGRGGRHVEVVDHRPGTEWVVTRAVELRDKWDARFAIAAGSPAASLITELEQAGVTVVVVTTGEHAEACGNLFDAIIEDGLRHLGQRELNLAVEGAERRYYNGDSWLWWRRQSLTALSPLVAITLALWLFEQPEENTDLFVAWG